MFNPFFIAGYGGPEYFCDRENETTKLINALNNNRNVAFISPRRLGKTALIQHAFGRISASNPKARCFYVDIFTTQNQAEFVALIGKKVIGELDSLTEKVMASITTFLKSCRPLFSFDPNTGVPSVSLTVEPTSSQQSLEEIFSYMNNSGYECYLAIDEFQQIASYPEKGTEALLRSLIQFNSHIHFVFAGSKQHLMAEMFTSPKRPFYQCCQKMGLDPLPTDTYYDFAAGLFAKYGRELPRITFERAYNIAHGYTWYIQDLMNRLFDSGCQSADEGELQRVLSDVKMEGEVVYKDYCALFSPGQLRLIRAIAADGTTEKPFEQSFMQRHKLTAASSVRQALKTLVAAGIISQSEQGYFISDRYFDIWLR